MNLASGVLKMSVNKERSHYFVFFCLAFLKRDVLKPPRLSYRCWNEHKTGELSFRDEWSLRRNNRKEVGWSKSSEKRRGSNQFYT